MEIKAILAAFFLVVSLRNGFGQSGLLDEYTQTARMDIYSDAWVSNETGDLNGFELALGKSNGSQRNALLFVYEGGSSEGIPLTATTKGNNLTVEGTWIEHLTEYPSKKDVVQARSVKIGGKLTPKAFRGKISIEGLEIVHPESMHLKRVQQTWFCKKPV